MKQILMILAAGMLLGSCSNDGSSRPCMLEGAWVMQEMRIPQGDTFSYNTNEGTRLRLYEGDSVMNEFLLLQTGKTLVVRPSERCGVRLIGKGSNEWVYLEEEEPRPLTMVDDSTITIQRMEKSIPVLPPSCAASTTCQNCNIRYACSSSSASRRKTSPPYWPAT